jgi:hypothetical protein
MRIRHLQRARRWRRRRFRSELGRLGPADVDVLLSMLRLRARWPRRWWWLEEYGEARVIGG